MRFRAGWILLCFFTALPGHAEQFGEVSVETLPGMAQKLGGGGYFTREFRLENRGEKPAQIRMRMRSFKRDMEFSAERSLLLPPGTVRSVQLFLPIASRSFRGHSYIPAFRDTSLDLTIDGRKVRHSLTLSDGSVIARLTLVSGSLPFSDYRKVLDDSFRQGETEVSAVPVAQWGREVRDYAGFHSVWISSEDRLPGEVETALMRWVFGGGTLAVCVPPDAAWPEGKEPGNGVAETRIGWGKRILCRPIPPGGLKPLALPKSGKRPRKMAKSARSGTAPAGADAPKDESPLHVEELSTRLRQGADNPRYEFTPGLTVLNALYTGKTGYERKSALETAELLQLEIPSIPLHWLFFVMLIFVILIGPVNYFVLRKLRREMLLLATTPAISLLFCLLVVGFITAGEGWHSRAKACGITLLDQERHLAATQVRLGVYAPIPPRELTFTSSDILNFSGAGEVRLSLDEGQRYSAGLIQPRIPFYATIWRVSPQREQLRITREKEGIAVVNGLGVRLAGLGVADDEGRWFVCEEAVAPGARVLLKPTSLRTGNGMNWETLLGNFDHSAAMGADFIRRNIGCFAPRTYVALAEEPLFCTPGFAPERFEATHLVCGRYRFSGEE